MLFLRRLPPAVRVQLTEDNLTDLRALAEKADRCAALISKLQLESHTVTAMFISSDAESNASNNLLVAAVSGQNNGGKRPWFKRKQQFNKKGGWSFDHCRRCSWQSVLHNWSQVFSWVLHLPPAVW